MPETVKGDWPHNSGVFICGAGLAIARPISFHGLLSMAQNIDLQRSFKAIESWVTFENLKSHYYASNLEDWLSGYERDYLRRNRFLCKI